MAAPVARVMLAQGVLEVRQVGTGMEAVFVRGGGRDRPDLVIVETSLPVEQAFAFVEMAIVAVDSQRKAGTYAGLPS